MNKFARIFDFPDGQLLVTVDYDIDDEKYWLRGRTDREGLTISLGLSGFLSGPRYDDTEAEALSRMELLTQEDAQRWYRALVSITDNPQKMPKKASRKRLNNG